MNERPKSRWGTYDVCVRGLLGPVMLSAVRPKVATLMPHITVVVTAPDAERDLVETLALLASTGLEVESVTVVPTSTPAERLPSRTPSVAGDEVTPDVQDGAPRV